jgi:homopolymeric O-antigen transport system permease protein
MPVAAHVPSTGPAAGPTLSPRPEWLRSFLLDASLAVGAYLTAYWLRFHDTRLETFLPGAWSTLPFVVIGQLAALTIGGAYSRKSGIDWLIRVIAGVVTGTIAASAAVGFSLGFEGVSRSAFLADALLMSVAATGWRGAWVLRTRAQARSRARIDSRPADPALVDRAAEMTTLRAVVLSLFNYRELLKNLVLKDIKLKYRGSVFGFLWSLANPLLMLVVYTLAFTYILRVRSEGFVFLLMLGLLSWTFFASSAAMSTGAIVDNSGLLKSVLFPRAILPIATVLFNLAQYLLTVSVFLPAMMLWHHVPPSAPILLFPVFLALQVVFTIGVALILATATAFFRDVRHLLEVALAVLFWTTPIVYELNQVPERLQLLILLSPVSSFVVAYQQLFFYRAWPEPTVWLMTSAYALGAFVVGALLFLASEDRFTEQL